MIDAKKIMLKDLSDEAYTELVKYQQYLLLNKNERVNLSETVNVIIHEWIELKKEKK